MTGDAGMLSGYLGLSTLQETVFPKAIHHSRCCSPKCHPETCVPTLTELQRWALSDKDSDIFMLVGDAGVGKSAIAQTFAEWCMDHNLLGASFFFSRACDVSYQRVHHMFPTIAYQLAEHIPSSRSYMNNVVIQGRAVIKSSIKVQLQKLIAEPLMSCGEVGKSRRIVVIDGLDEFPGVPLLRRILGAVNDTLKTYPALPLRFLVTARTNSADVLTLPCISSTLRLEGRFAASEQIRIFLQAELQKIPVFITRQPSPVDMLVRRSSGRFVYASALAGFLADELHDPNERLDQILSWDDVPAGSSELDRLYLHILRGASLDKDLLRQILGFLVRCPSHIGSFSNLVDLPPHDVIILLRNVSPIIHLPDPKAYHFSDKIHIRHMSLIDLLTDKARASSFFLDDDQLSHLDVAKVSKLSFDGRIRKALSTMGIKTMPELPLASNYFPHGF